MYNRAREEGQERSYGSTRKHTRESMRVAKGAIESTQGGKLYYQLIKVTGEKLKRSLTSNQKRKIARRNKRIKQKLN